MLNFILASAGITWVLTRSKLFKSFREYVSRKENLYSIAVKSTELKSVKNQMKFDFYTVLDGLFSCAGCMGFWVGMGVSSILIPEATITEVILNGFVSSISSLILISLSIFLERK